MLDKWVQILNSQPVGTSGTAKEWGCSAATLCAMVKRGYMSKSGASPAVYTKLPTAVNYILTMLYAAKHPNDNHTVDLYKDGEKLGMLCQIDGHDVKDCWGENYDLRGVSGVMVWKDGKPNRIPWKEIFGTGA